jgi:hypothetical protein
MLTAPGMRRALPHTPERDGKGPGWSTDDGTNGAPVLMVSTDAGEMERELRAGTLRCPQCTSGELRPWGSSKQRRVRGIGERRELKPRRSRCRNCRGTHVLQSVAMFARRKDEAEVIGRTLMSKTNGFGHRRIAAEFREHFTQLAHRFGADLRLEPRGSPLAYQCIADQKIRCAI